MNILVSGGAGFIASHLVDSLVALGHQVSVVDNLASGKREYLNPQAKFFEIDINDPKLSEIFAAGAFDYCFHLAAQIDVRKSVADPAFDNQVNAVGSLRVIENCLKYKVKRIICASTGGALYGEADILPTPENYPTSPLSPYGIHKLTMEKYLYYYYQVFHQPYTVLRLANVYGPRQYKGGEAGVVSIFVDRAIAKKPSTIYGDGKQTRDYVYVGDVVQAFLKTLAVDYNGAINIGTGVESDLRQVVQAIEKALGEKMIVKEEAAKAGEQRRSCLDNALAAKILDWKPQVALEPGIRETINWSRNK